MATIEMTPVDSSQIAALGHDPDTKTLAVQFNGGGLYHYDNVDAELFDRFRNADSIGSFFHKNIKSDPKAYPYRRVIEQQGQAEP